MPRNGTGGYSLPSNSWNPAINGAAATAADWQNLINDVASAIQQSVSSDGQTPMTGNLDMGGFVLTGLGAPSGTGQSLRWEQLTKGGDIASAAALPIPIEGAYFNVTGTTTITSMTDVYPGRLVYLKFTGAVTLTNSASLVLPDLSTYTTTPGDIMVFLNDSPGVWVCVAYPNRLVGRLLKTTYYTTPGSVSYVKTSGTRFAVVEVLGGGGGSGGVGNPGTGVSISFGGYGGGYAMKLIANPVDGTLITVGSGGAAGAAGASTGGTGQTTSFGSVVSATGGLGGSGTADVSSLGLPYMWGTSNLTAGGLGIGGDMNLRGGVPAPSVAFGSTDFTRILLGVSGGSVLSPGVAGRADTANPIPANMYGVGGPAVGRWNGLSALAGIAGSSGWCRVTEYA